MLRTYRISEADGITDAVKTTNDVYVLDGAAPEPTVIRVRRNGREAERFTVEPELQRGLSGLSVDEGGEAVLELFGGVTLLGPDSQPVAARGTGGRNYTVNIPDQGGETEAPSEGTVELDGRTVATIRVQNTLGGLSVLAATPEGDIYVLVEELTSTPEIVIDQTVRHYRADGTLVGIARVPVAERFTFVSHGVAVGPDRQVYALITRPRRADVIQLEFNVSLPEILPAPPEGLRPPPISAAACRRRRGEVRVAADEYINNTTYLRAERLNGACRFRQRPTYLSRTAGRYKSIPYDWGGFDSVATYNNYMNGRSGTYKAGDRKERFEPRNSTASCSRGVDCSGFVSRCWGLTAKEGTSSLPRISAEIPARALQTGDILNKAGKHVLIFDKRATNPRGGSEQGVYVWESTQTNNYDRVVYRWVSWSRLNGYVPRRYRYIC